MRDGRAASPAYRCSQRITPSVSHQEAFPPIRTYRGPAPADRQLANISLDNTRFRATSCGVSKVIASRFKALRWLVPRLWARSPRTLRGQQTNIERNAKTSGSEVHDPASARCAASQRSHSNKQQSGAHRERPRSSMCSGSDRWGAVLAWF